MRKAEPPPLSSADTLFDSQRLILGEGLDHLQAHLAGCHDGDAEAIHQARIALRRLRSALRLFRRHLDPVARDGFNAALRALGRTLGAARDWDVFVLETIPAVRAGSDAIETLAGPAQGERDAAHLRLRAVLEDPQTQAILHDLRDWSGLPAAFAEPADADRTIGHEAGRMLDRLVRSARRRGRKLDRQDDIGRHALRKSLKSLRYGLEMLQSLHEHQAAKPYRKALSHLQEELGQLNDAIAAVELADRLPDGPGRDAVRHWSHKRKRAALEGLPAAWHRFRKMPTFW